MMDSQQVLSRLNFGRVDGETDNRFEQCFIGTEMLRQVLLPQHSLVVGNKGSGKSAISRLLVEDLNKVRPLLPKQYEEIFCIPAYGLQSEEYIPSVELRELNPTTVDEFRYFWLLYLGLKVASTLINDEKVQSLIAKTKKKEIREAHSTLRHLLIDVGLINQKGFIDKIAHKIQRLKRSKLQKASTLGNDKYLADFKQRTGVSIIAMLEAIDTILRETNCLAWIMLDKLDLLYVDDIQKMRASITGLVQLLVQYGNQFKNIQFKIFLRNDIYRQLHIVNKSHLISYTTEMKWRGPLLLKLLVSRAVVDPAVSKYCQEILGEEVDVTNVIIGSDDYVERVFYTIFEPTVNSKREIEPSATSTHQWILKRLIDGMGNSFPRELIHLGNKAVEQQREIDRIEGKNTSNRLISTRALKEAFQLISQYRCDTYLYSEFPHLSKHFDVFRGSDSAVFHREELYMLFEPLNPKGDEAIRAVFDVGLLMPLGSNVDSSRKFKVPLLYRDGLGITERRRKPYMSPRKIVRQQNIVEIARNS
ncbi:MAG: hypothetical protein QME52_11430 [Bacteroidota bacterium]|nr:hypothetical protein [Bacteroidota bacterium]